MASEITGTLTASPVKIQQHFDLDRVASQPDNNHSESATGQLGLVKSKEGMQEINKKLGEQELALTSLQKQTEEAKDEDKLTEKVSQLNDYAQRINREIQFSVHKETDQTIVKVIDSESDEVIRQIPSEQVLKIAESLENFSGILLKEQA